MIEVHWTRILGNKYSVKPDKKMISTIQDEGCYLKVQNVSVQGEPKFKKLRSNVKKVKYDADYLNAYYKSKLGDALDLPWNDLQKLIKGARDARKKKVVQA